MRAIPQAGAITYRDGEAGPEFMLITSSNRLRWQFPKGMIDPGDTAVETAAKETYEEAGIVVDVGQALGTYQYSKWGLKLEVQVFLAKYKEDAEEWEEEGHRNRLWASHALARERISRYDLKELLDAALACIESRG